MSSNKTNECKDGKEKLGLDQGYSLLQRFDRMSSSESEWQTKFTKLQSLFRKGCVQKQGGRECTVTGTLEETEEIQKYSWSRKLPG